MVEDLTLDVEKTRTAGFVALVGVALVAVYWPSLGGDFLWDDDTHYTANSVLHDGGLLRTWLGGGQPNYWPLTWTSYWLEHRFVGLDSTVSHCINLFLHGANVLLIALIGRRLGIPLAWGVALLFALHPANVESVAWITQRKNLLAMLFALAATAEFSFHLEKPSRAATVSSVLLFAASMLSKGAAVGLPLVLLLIAWWRRVPLDRSLALRVAPHFTLAAIFSILEIAFMSKVRSGEEVFDLTLLERGELIVRNLSFYLQTSVAPIDLMFVYPRWQLGRFALLDVIPLLLWLALSAAIFIRKPDGWQGVVASQAIFLVMLAPVLGVFDIYFFKYSYVADHYLYLAMPAMIILAVAGVHRLSTMFARAAVLVACFVFAIASWNQSRSYTGDEALWAGTVAKNPDAWIAHTLLGVIAQNDGQHEKAQRRFETALSLSPSKPDLGGIHLNLGNVLQLQGNPGAATAHFEQALRERPGLTQAWCNLAIAYAQMDEFARHDEIMNEALEAADNKARVHYVFAQSLHTRGFEEDARRHLEEAMRLDPKLRNQFR